MWRVSQLMVSEALFNTRGCYDAALPILAEHVERDYPLYIEGAIARLMVS